jgi:hypothetical protein
VINQHRDERDVRMLLHLAFCGIVLVLLLLASLAANAWMYWRRPDRIVVDRRADGDHVILVNDQAVGAAVSLSADQPGAEDKRRLANEWAMARWGIDPLAREQAVERLLRMMEPSAATKFVAYLKRNSELERERGERHQATWRPQLTVIDANLAAIRLLKELQTEGRMPTTKEQDVLGRYVGWGQFPDLFNEINEAGQKLAAEREELKSLLGEQEYERAKRSTLNAHYTALEVVQRMWEIVRKLGFQGGRVLEPSMGVGYFFGLMPRDLMEQSKLAGVEIDPTTGAIARMLYPNASINVKGFQEVRIADGFYNLTIGNVPFGDFRVHDPAYNKYRANIHDYFILKSLDKTCPGGIVAVITSTGTLDKADPKIRQDR